MGMFDYIIIECDLPVEVPDIEKAEWQTKDTPAQFLITYIITKDGRLECLDYDKEIVKDKTSFLGFHIRRKNLRREQIDFMGSINLVINHLTHQNNYNFL